MALQKQRVRILVQENGETAAKFAERIEKFVDKLSKEFLNVNNHWPFQFTTASDGRQTVNIQFLSDKLPAEE